MNPLDRLRSGREQVRLGVLLPLADQAEGEGEEREVDLLLRVSVGMKDEVVAVAVGAAREGLDVVGVLLDQRDGFVDDGGGALVADEQQESALGVGSVEVAQELIVERVSDDLLGVPDLALADEDVGVLDADEDVGSAQVVEGFTGGCAFEDRVQADQQDVADLVLAELLGQGRTAFQGIA